MIPKTKQKMKSMLVVAFFRETDIQRNVGLQEIARDFKGSGRVFAHYFVYVILSFNCKKIAIILTNHIFRKMTFLSMLAFLTFSNTVFFCNIFFKFIDPIKL